MQILSGKGDTEVIHYPLYETDTFGTRFIFFLIAFIIQKENVILTFDTTFCCSFYVIWK